jgi:hypothetical protein
MRPAWTADWAWGLPLIALTTVIHVAAIIGVAMLLARVRTLVEKRGAVRSSAAVFAIGVMGALGLALAALNGLEVSIWAGAYLLLGAIDTPADAMLYSMNAMTAYGSSGLDLAPHWKMMGALEAANGLLLFGISTAFLAAVITELWTWLRKMSHGP